MKPISVMWVPDDLYETKANPDQISRTLRTGQTQVSHTVCNPAVVVYVHYTKDRCLSLVVREVKKGAKQCRIEKEVMSAPTNADRTHLVLSHPSM